MSEALFPPAPRPLAKPKRGAAAEALARLREPDMLDLLTQRYSADYGNGQRYVCARHVRSHAGFDAARTADFIAMDTWASRLALHGHEVKVSRADWLTELKQPEKSGEFIPYMNYWWLVISDASYVREGELPPGWGLMAVVGGSLRVVRRAPRRDSRVLPPTRLAALLRAVWKTATSEARSA
jgi:hypothetical protein